MRPYLLLYVTDTARSRVWYEQLGFTHRRSGRHASWVELEWADTASQGFLLYLYANWEAQPSKFMLPGFEVQEPLEGLAARLSALSVGKAPEIVDEGFGRILNIRDPDGYQWQVVEHEPELYT